jgi:hypothetical protein
LAPILCLPCSVLVPQASAIPGNTTTSPGTLESGRELGKRTFLLVMGLPGSSLTTQGSAVRTRHRPPPRMGRSVRLFEVSRHANTRSARREIQQKSNIRGDFAPRRPLSPALNPTNPTRRKSWDGRAQVRILGGAPTRRERARPAPSRRGLVINGAFSVPTTPWTRQTRSAGAASS